MSQQDHSYTLIKSNKPTLTAKQHINQLKWLLKKDDVAIVTLKATELKPSMMDWSV